MPRAPILSEILQPRAEEIFHLLWDEIRRAGFEKSLNSGIALTGGGAMLEGTAENRRADLLTCRSAAGVRREWAVSPITSTVRHLRPLWGW